MNKVIYGYKTFDENLKSLLGNQFEIGKTYEIEEDNLKIRINRFHFCEDVYDIFKYYRPKIRKIRICKIKAENIIIKDVKIIIKIKHCLKIFCMSVFL